MTGRRPSLILAALGLTACYEPSFEPCRVTCAPDGDPCPGDLECRGGVCTLPGGACLGIEPEYRAITGGAGHLCAILANEIVCWGDNSHGQLAQDPATLRDSDPIRITTPATGGGTWVSIAAGARHTCALFDPMGETQPDELYCWGDDASMQLGTAGGPTFWSPRVPPGERWIGVGAGDDHSCGIAQDVATSAQRIYCWGSNAAGQLGTAAGASHAEPVAVDQLPARSWRIVDGGVRHTCAVSSASEVWCWGDNASGQLGRTGPGGLAAVAGSGFRATTAGADHTCAITVDAAVRCWGANPGDRLGLGAGDVVDAPAVVGAEGMTATWAALDTAPLATCGLKNGLVYCWGDGFAQDGLGTLGTGQLAPADTVVDSATVTAADAAVATTASSACVFEGGSTVRCWGDSPHGELGDGTRTIEWDPVVVMPPASTTWQEVIAGARNTCAVVRNGAAQLDTYCWGLDDNGQAPGPTVPEVSDVTRVPGLLPTASTPSAGTRGVAIGDQHTCIVSNSGLNDSEIRCWGDDSRMQNPVDVAGDPFTLVLSASPRITADRDFSCVTGTTEHYAKCWGTADPMHAFAIPTRVGTPAVLQPQTVTWGFESGCGLDNASSFIWCFGTEHVGELGNGVGAGATWPGGTQLATFNPMQRMGHGTGQTRCAADNGLGIWCWGENGSGQVAPDGGPGSDFEAPSLTIGSAAINGSVSDVATGREHVCAIVKVGTELLCWGGYDRGQRGAGATTTAPTSIPAPAPPGTTWTGLAAGGHHTCAIASGAPPRLYCWGANTYGQIGNDRSARPRARMITPAP